MADFTPYATVKHEKIRTVTLGSITIDNGTSAYLEIDSGTNGGEVLSIIITAALWSIDEWVVRLYIPPLDGFLAPEVEDKKDEFDWAKKTEAGLIPGIIAFPYNMFLEFSNTATGVGSAKITDVIIVYHSEGTLSLAWEE